MMELIRLLAPFPSVENSNKKCDGLSYKQPKICMKCPTSCWVSWQDHIEPIRCFVCPKGISLVSLSFTYGKLLLNGIIVKGLNNQCPPQLRKKLQEQKVAIREITGWHNNIIKNISTIEMLSEQKAIELVNGLHNVKAAVNLVTRNAEAIVANLCGETDDEKIEGADSNLKALLKSVELLRTRLLMTSILSNPESAKYGQKRPIAIYRLFHKMVHLFVELAAKEMKFLKMSGESYALPFCYDSIESLALVLIDNAVKYTRRGGTIEVFVNDKAHNSVAVEIRSEGPVVPDDMVDKIFEKGVRTNEAKSFASDGSGFGLYIATIIANAHGFKISYAKQSYKSKTNGINIFSFIIK